MTMNVLPQRFCTQSFSKCTKLSSTWMLHLSTPSPASSQCIKANLQARENDEYQCCLPIMLWLVCNQVWMHFWRRLQDQFDGNDSRLASLNSLSAMDGHDRPLLNELCSTVVSCRIFIRSWSLIARWTCNDFSLPAVIRNFYEAFFEDDVSKGSKLYLFALVNIVQYLPICLLCQ